MGVVTAPATAKTVLGALNAKDFGADPRPSVDNAAALSAAFAALPATGGVLYIPPGDYAVGNTVTFTEKKNVTIYAQGALIYAKSTGDFRDGSNANKPLVSLLGSEKLTIHGLNIECNQIVDLTKIPSCGLLQARGAGSGAGQRIYNCDIAGTYTITTVMNIAGETEYWEGCVFTARLPGQAIYYDTHADASRGLTASTVTSNTRKTFLHCFFNNYGPSTSEESVGIILAGGASRINFYEAYFAIGGTARVGGVAGTGSNGPCTLFNLIDEKNPSEANFNTSLLRGLTITNLRLEKVNGRAEDRIVVANKTGGVSNIVYFGTDSLPSDPTTMDYLFEVRKGLSACDFDFVGEATGKDLIYVTGTGTLGGCPNISGGLSRSSGTVGRIQVDAGGVAQGNKLFTSVAGVVFKGAGTYADATLGITNKIIAQGSSGPYDTIQATETLALTLSDSVATPNISGASLFNTNNTTTTHYTNFLHAFGVAPKGQLLTIRVKDNFTYFDHGTNLKLPGGVNMKAPNGSVVTFRKDEVDSCWRLESMTDASAKTIAGKTGAYALTDLDWYVAVNATSGTFAITLPLAADRVGKTYIIRKTDTGSNAITFTLSGSDSVDTQALAPLTTFMETVYLTSLGSSSWMSWRYNPYIEDKISSKSADASIALYERTVLVDATGGNRTMTLPAASAALGKRFIFQKIDSSGNAMNVAPAGSDTIDGAGSGSPKTTSTQYGKIIVRAVTTTRWMQEV